MLAEQIPIWRRSFSTLHDDPPQRSISELVPALTSSFRTSHTIFSISPDPLYSLNLHGCKPPCCVLHLINKFINHIKTNKMKNLVTITAVALMLTSTAFGEGTHPINGKATTRDSVAFSILSGNRGVNVSIEKNEAGNSIVEIYDGQRRLILVDKFANRQVICRNYIIGDDDTYYFIVQSKNQRVEKKITVAHTTNQSVTVAD
jgi:hypothetical protein